MNPYPPFSASGKVIVLLIGLILSALTGLPVSADENAAGPEIQLGVTATTPSRLEEPADESSGSVTVLSGPEIGAQNPVSAPEVLRDLPGVSLQESGTMGESAALTLRGSNPNQTLIMLDGIRLNSPFRGDFDLYLGGLMMDQIGQIEVVRGAQSALYGSDAMGGVVNLKTQGAQGPPESSFTQEVGNEGTFREAVSMSEKRSQMDYALTFARTDTEGQFDRDRFGASSFTGQVGVPVRENGRLQFISRLQSDSKELAIDVVPVTADAVQVFFDQNDEIRKRFFFNTLQYEDRLAPRFELSWKVAAVDTKLNWDNPPDPSSGNSDDYFENTDTRTVIVDLQQNVLVSDTDTLSFGFDRQRDEVDSEIKYFGTALPVNQSRDNTGYYLQNLFKWGKQFVLQAGVRTDDNQSFGTVTNPKVSSAYDFQNTGTKLRASWGTGFRAPTIQELFFPAVGNPDLQPEKSRSWEAGVQQKVFGETMLLDAAYFRIDYRDLIQIGPTTIVNIGEARTQGVESSLEVRLLSTLTAKANYTYLDAKDRTTDEELPFRPRQIGNIGLLYAPTANFVAHLDINMASSQAISADFILPDGSLLQGRCPGYTRVDLSAAYHLFRSYWGVHETRFFVKLKNLFDQKYQEVPGFPAPGINYLAGLTAAL
ncbi:MAG TPA: TonB-dependent receptor [Nitrospiria bacterium]|nr:TonB-dependent receptor [Nitrospiria bacterium]